MSDSDSVPSAIVPLPSVSSLIGLLNPFVPGRFRLGLRSGLRSRGRGRLGSRSGGRLGSGSGCWANSASSSSGVSGRSAILSNCGGFSSVYIENVVLYLVLGPLGLDCDSVGSCTEGLEVLSHLLRSV
jgi:hypothetical protein